MKSDVSLLVIEGADQGSRFALDGEVLIGRGSQNRIRILDTEASRTHARIYPDGSSWRIDDLHSSNGTYVNGNKIDTALLESGDQIRLGRTLLVLAMKKPDHSSVAQVDLIGGSSQSGHSQIIRSWSPQDTHREAGAQTGPGSALHSEDVLYVMGEIAEQAVRPSVTLSELLDRVLRMIVKTIHADRGCILLIDSETGMVVPQATHIPSASRLPGTSPVRMPVSKSIVDYVIRTGNSVRSTDPLHDTRFDPGHSILQAGVKEALCVPMTGRMALLGAIYLDVTEKNSDRTRIDDDEDGEQQLTDEKLKLLTAVARQCALAIENFHYQQSLVDAERLAAIGQTIATLSHHIKNILQGVRGGSYLIDRGLKQNENDLILKGWNLVEKNQEKIYHLVMDMLTYSKERTPTIEFAAINEVVNDVFELMEQRAQECAVQLKFEPQEDIPKSSFDPEAMHRAVLNIVTNAIDAADHGDHPGEVLIRTRFDPRSNLLSVIVKDNGEGISAEVKDRLFNVFESTKGARGTGIGLAVSQKILREHGGDITVISEVNEGAEFTLSWPYSTEAAGSDIHGSRTMSGLDEAENE